jgi:hypothetical protein
MIDQYDHLEIRCPMLGHPLTFHYCRTTFNAIPCRKLLDCWHERIPVREFAEEFLDPMAIDVFTRPPKAKMASLLELIERARESQKNCANPEADDSPAD